MLKSKNYCTTITTHIFVTYFLANSWSVWHNQAERSPLIIMLLLLFWSRLLHKYSPAIKKVFKNQEFHNWVVWKTMVEYDSCFCTINNLLVLHILVTSFPYIFGSFHAYLKWEISIVKDWYFFNFLRNGVKLIHKKKSILGYPKHCIWIESTLE